MESIYEVGERVELKNLFKIDNNIFIPSGQYAVLLEGPFVFYCEEITLFSWRVLLASGRVERITETYFLK